MECRRFFGSRAVIALCCLAHVSAAAQELPSREEEADMRELGFRLFQAENDSASFVSILEDVVSFRNQYPESMYTDRLLHYEIDIRAALGAECSELRTPAQGLLASDSYPLEAIQLAAKLSRFDCFDIVVADILATLDPPIGDRRGDDVAQYHRLRSQLELRRGDQLASTETLLDGLRMLSAKAPQQCTTHISEYLDEAADALDLELGESFPALEAICE